MSPCGVVCPTLLNPIKAFRGFRTAWLYLVCQHLFCQLGSVCNYSARDCTNVQLTRYCSMLLIYKIHRHNFNDCTFSFSFTLSFCHNHRFFQPCCRGNGDSRLEVHGSVPSSPGGWSLPLPGFCPVPFPWTPTQAPQTVLTALQRGIYIHTHTLIHTQIAPTCRDKLSPCCYLLHYLQPLSNLPLPLWPIENLLYLVSSKDGGKKENTRRRGTGEFKADVCYLQKPHQHTAPLLCSSGLVRSDIVLLPVCEDLT